MDVEIVTRTIIQTVRTFQQGVSRDKILDAVMRENPNTPITHNGFNSLLISLERSAAIRLGDNRRYYLY